MTTRTFVPRPWQIPLLRDKKITLLVVPVKPQPGEGWSPAVEWYHPIKVAKSGEQYPGPKVFGASDEDCGIVSPFGYTGTILNCKEPWCHRVNADDRVVYNKEGNLDTNCFWYRADNPEVEAADDDGFMKFRKDGTQASPWISPARMPAYAVRIKPTVVSVEVKRVREIEHEECCSYGIGAPMMFTWMTKKPFQKQFSLDHPGAWESNAWCWFCTLEWRKQA